MYSLKFDTPRRTLHLELQGFWSGATLMAFAAEMRAEVAALNARGETFAILSDCRRFPVQSLEVATGFERMMQHGGGPFRGPSAIVVASVLSKMQAERIFGGPHVRVFLAVKEAQAWLDTEWCVPKAKETGSHAA